MKLVKIVIHNSNDSFNEYYLKYIRILAAESGMTQEEIESKYKSEYNIEFYDPLYVKSVMDIRDIIDLIIESDVDTNWSQDEQIMYNRVLPFLNNIETIINNGEFDYGNLCSTQLVPAKAAKYCYVKINKKDNFHYIRYNINKFIEDFHPKDDTTLEEYKEFIEVLKVMII